MKKIGLYEISVIIFLVFLPIIGSSFEVCILTLEAGTIGVMFKWFVFSGVGLRLFTAGLKQAINPSFTAKEIFKAEDEKSSIIVREIGLANISIGLVGILSIFLSGFRFVAAMTGGLYFGLAGCLHLFNRKRSKEEMLPMITDFYIALVLLILAIFNI